MSLSSADREQQKQTQRRRERDSQIRGLIYLAGAVILFTIVRFGLHRAFTPHWWLP